ncbi:MULTISPECIES: ribbon-helix-helix domain-containing protein [unclassified Streptomyces]|uniref:ribbon-helix-helix domain-containing protein n=1 Tax=unclassified Streptomyces TaxID=2593676 RepID=UPI002E0D9CA7|nr:ribbon-helix-helix domain-containing protein [Streptomyces sp. NBC_01197]WSS49234.1 ribbon-helix-helix domain-containing protein [Streptomyces sp. NBC_01180]
MKISVSLPQEDVALLDRYAADTGKLSRSAVIHHAIELLRSSRLEADYAEAWDEWEAGEDAALWERTAGDGVSGAQR